MGSVKISRIALPPLIRKPTVRWVFYFCTLPGSALMRHPLFHPALGDMQLLLDRQMRIIKYDGVFSLPEGADGPVRIDIIPMRQVLFHFRQRNIRVLLVQLL